MKTESIKPDLRKGLCLSLSVLAAMLLLTWLALMLKLDLKVASYFFSDQYGWVHKDTQPFKALYLYGTIPGLVLTLGALLIYFYGFIKRRWQPYQKPMLVIVLTSVLGAGLLVNGILKPYCGRPRPREIITFGGQWEFCSPCFNKTPGKGLSFPCGHCTMGFLFVTLIYLRSKSPAAAYGGSAFGLLYGGMLGVARAAQGAHFVTDTLWSLGVLLIVSLLLYHIVIPLLQRSWLKSRMFSNKQIVGVGIVIVIVLGVITLTFLTRRPFYKMTAQRLRLPNHLAQVVIHSNVAITRRSVNYKDGPSRAALIGRGFGWHKAKEKVKITTEIQDATLHIEVNVVKDGYFAESQHELFLTLPVELKDRIRIEQFSGQE